MATAIHYRSEIAIARNQISRLLLKNYPEEKKTAFEHLEFAIAEFRDMKMQPFLERALRHREILKA